MTEPANQIQSEQSAENPLHRAITLLEQSAGPFDEACRILRELASEQAGMLVKLTPRAVPAQPKAPAWFEPCPEWVEYQATDEHGAIWGYQIKPQPGDIGDTVWYHQGGLSYRLGTAPPPANWRETLVARPKPKEVKTCATSQPELEPEKSPATGQSSFPTTTVASPAPQQSNPADRGAEADPQDDAADREMVWLTEEEIQSVWGVKSQPSGFVHQLDTQMVNTVVNYAIARERARAHARAEVGEKWTEDEIRKRFEEQFKYLDLKRNSPGGYVCYSTRDQYYGFLAGVKSAQQTKKIIGAGEALP